MPSLDDSMTWMNVDLPTKFRAVAFHTKMGLFNVAQFPLQLQTMAIITALNPKHGLSAAHVGAWMARLHLTGDDPRVLNQWSKWAAKITPGWTPEQFAESPSVLCVRLDLILLAGSRAIAMTSLILSCLIALSVLFLILELKPFTAAELRWVRLAAGILLIKITSRSSRLAGKADRSGHSNDPD